MDDGLDLRCCGHYGERNGCWKFQDYEASTLGREREKELRQSDGIGNLSTFDWNILTMDHNMRTAGWNVTATQKSFTGDLHYLSTGYDRMSFDNRVKLTLEVIQYIYYPILAIVGVPVNIVTIVILAQGKCGLSKCVTSYLAAMATADILVIIFDLILRQIPIVYFERFLFLMVFRVCNIHAVLLYAVTDCSVWFTVAFTFDRFVVICCQKMKPKYCNEKTAAVVLGIVTVLSCFKNIFWYFLLTARYWLLNYPWFCFVTFSVKYSLSWAIIEFIHNIITPAFPFVLIMLLNILTIRHILISSASRRRLQHRRNGESSRDPEMESRRKSIILLFVISGNFILLWTVFMVYSVWNRMQYLGHNSMYLPQYVQEMGFMLQLLSCCTNTAIYAITQTKFREQFKNIVKYPFSPLYKFIKCVEHYPARQINPIS
ncbi:probable G-protein coupled receptor 139 [Scyliorhinus canicula]|uniref:probable G-protein coupled receptor 139 n=1 Tax=Scyliorhinus canicula TaxID=7830 RepID=UPI0018F5E4CB|nr:probable G-protein coupled receptor 139 [Scyliorhinus canicula]